MGGRVGANLRNDEETWLVLVSDFDIKINSPVVSCGRTCVRNTEEYLDESNIKYRLVELAMNRII